MKKLRIILSLVLPAIFLFSCTTSKEPVVGVWECVKLIPIQESLQSTGTAPQPMEESTLKADEKGEISPSSDPVLQQLLAAHPDLTETIKIKGNNTAVLTSGTESVTGTWKLNKETSTLDVTLKKTKRVIRFKIPDLSYNYLTMHEKVPSGEFEIHFQKMK
ncbi:MAG: hypothetical protein ABIJ04_08675 [Bacteroidota bacterium]